MLDAAFEEMYVMGFRGASVDRILESTGVTKGALYHHFKNKKELGYAVLDEAVAVWIERRWLEPLAQNGDALDVLKSTIKTAFERAVATGAISKGCPLNNLAQEMSSLDEGFRSRIQRLFDRWTSAFTDVIRRGQREGVVRPEVDADDTAQFLVAAVEGMVGLLKSNPKLSLAVGQLNTLFLFLDGLRTPASEAT